MKFNDGDKVKVVISGNIDSISAFYEASELGWGDDEMAEVVTNQKVGVVTGNWSDHKGYVVKFDNDEYWTFFPEHLQLVEADPAFEMIETEEQKREDALIASVMASALFGIVNLKSSDNERIRKCNGLIDKLVDGHKGAGVTADDVIAFIEEKSKSL